MRKISLFLLFAAATFISAAQQTDTISRTDILTAGKLFSINFTAAEIDSMYFTILQRNIQYKRRYPLKLENSVPMSLWQSPVLPGMQFETVQKPVKWELPKNVSMPSNKNDLAFYSVLQLAALIKSKKITSVELTQFFIDRIKKWGDTLQCVISITEDIAMQQARAADAEIAAGNYRGPLHGIPYGLKDLFAVKGTKTTWGASVYKDQVIDEDAYVYTKLKEAGAVLVAKFTLGALAQGDWWFGGRTKIHGTSTLAPPVHLQEAPVLPLQDWFLLPSAQKLLVRLFHLRIQMEQPVYAQHLAQ